MKACQPEIVYRRGKPGCRVSVILLDWGVRESFHSLYYLNQQTAHRDSYELIWLEFYKRRPQGLGEMFGQALDTWIVAGYPDDIIFNKHRLYNLGILAACGDIVIFCDSDAMYSPTFIEKVVAHFQQLPRTALHVDELRNLDRSYYPFRFPERAEVLKGCANWNGTISKGLGNSPDPLHDANYGACMAARREDLIAIGGADEHLDYLGYICGAYEMTFRLANAGRAEHWLRDEFLVHTWHPNENGINTDYQGPHDGLYVSLRALETRVNRRVLPYVQNPWLNRARCGQRLALESVLGELGNREEPSWQKGRQPTEWNDVYWMERDFQGYNIFLHRDRWYGVRVGDGHFEPDRKKSYRPLLEGVTHRRVRDLITLYNRVPSKLLAQIRCQPLYELPYRVARRLVKAFR